MTAADFSDLIGRVTGRIHGRALDNELEALLNREFGAESPEFAALRGACEQAIAAGWMCAREAGGIRFGRVIKPGGATHGFSVDVVEMTDITGPHHRHPNGEIDLIMPLEGEAKFDGRGKGWLVYGPGTAHYPTVVGGKALVLYLLPGGAIEFT